MSDTREAGTCPTCGASVRVVSSDEGTSHYEPAGYDALIAELEEYRIWGVVGPDAVDLCKRAATALRELTQALNSVEGASEDEIAESERQQRRAEEAEARVEDALARATKAETDRHHLLRKVAELRARLRETTEESRQLRGALTNSAVGFHAALDHMAEFNDCKHPLCVLSAAALATPEPEPTDGEATG